MRDHSLWVKTHTTKYKQRGGDSSDPTSHTAWAATLSQPFCDQSLNGKYIGQAGISVGDCLDC